MTLTVLYPEAMYPDPTVEHRLYGPEVRVLMRDTATLDELDAADCEAADGLMIFRHFLRAGDFARFPRLKAVVRMGVGYDRLDRKEAAARGVLVCNVPDYGTAEVADHALALALALRRGLLLHHERQRATPPAPWTWFAHPLVKRSSGSDLRHPRARTHRHRGGAQGKGVRVSRARLRSLPAERGGACARDRARAHPRGIAARERYPLGARAAHARDARPCSGRRNSRRCRRTRWW